MRKFACVIVCFSLFNSMISSSCNKEPYKPDYSNIRGYVIGKETCHVDESQDYWLVDFTYDPTPPKIGDTLVLNGVVYTNVLKVKGLDPQLKQIGMRVSIDYKTISTAKIITTGCSVSTPVTYPLKEIFILHQFEIR